MQAHCESYRAGGELLRAVTVLTVLLVPLSYELMACGVTV